MEEFISKIIDICTVEDLMNGYVYDHHHRDYTCIFCGKNFQEDLIYKYEDGLCSARRAMEVHILESHKGSFDFLINMDKKYTSLTDRQTEIYQIFYNENDNRIIAKEMDTTPATVRSYKFKMREKMIQSKVYMALFNLIEEEKNKGGETDNASVREIARYERLKNIEKDLNESENHRDLGDIINENYKGVDLNSMNLFIDKGGPGMDK